MSQTCPSRPSQRIHTGCRGRGANPIAHVLQAIDEPLDLIEYNRWNVILPEGQFLTEVGNDQFEDVLQQVSPSGIPEWRVSAVLHLRVHRLRMPVCDFEAQAHDVLCHESF